MSLVLSGSGSITGLVPGGIPSEDLAYTPAGTGAVETTVQDKLRESVSLQEQFPDGFDPSTTDCTPYARIAVDALQLKGGGIINLPSGDILFSSKLALSGIGSTGSCPVGITFRGAGMDATVIKCANTSDAVFECVGAYYPAGPKYNRGLVFEDLTLDGSSGGLSAVKLTGFYNLGLRRVRQTAGFTGVAFDFQQVWDSWIEDCYIAGTSTSFPAMRFHYGTTDNCNNIRFSGTTFEAAVWSIDSVSGAGTANKNYAFSFDNCKFEAYSGAQGCISHSGGITLDWSFTNISIGNTANATANPFLKFTSTVAGLFISNIHLSQSASGTTAPFLYARGADNLTIDSVYAYGPAYVAGTTKFVDIDSTSKHFFASNVSYNGGQIDPFAGVATSVERSTFSPFDFYSENSGSYAFKVNVAGVIKYINLVIDSFGTLSFLPSGGAKGLRINTAGKVTTGIADTGTVSAHEIVAATGHALFVKTSEPSASSYSAINADRVSSDGAVATWYRAGLQVGAVNVTSSVTTYATSSDYRLKTITGPVVNSGAFIDALKPKVGTWKSNNTPFVGFLAHEFAEVSPTSVVGEKDAVDAEGLPNYQSMQASTPEVIANMIAELQSLRVRISNLEAL